tara:strand:+ start:235 stop:414 length:180 start_codon:yes stop_codon:yes gene_type:complete
MAEINQEELDNNINDQTLYKTNRVYPSIKEQLDMIYHAGEGGPEFQAAIKAVKAAHPKP